MLASTLFLEKRVEIAVVSPTAPWRRNNKSWSEMQGQQQTCCCKWSYRLWMTRRSADARRSRLNQVGGEGDDDGNKFSFLYCQIMKEATVTRLSRHFFFQVLFGQVLSSHCHFVRKLFTFSLELKKKSRRRTHCWYVQRERCRRNDGGIRLAPNLRAECEKAEHPHQRGSRVSESSYLCVCVTRLRSSSPFSLRCFTCTSSSPSILLLLHMYTCIVEWGGERERVTDCGFCRRISPL